MTELIEEEMWGVSPAIIQEIPSKHLRPATRNKLLDIMGIHRCREHRWNFTERENK